MGIHLNDHVYHISITETSLSFSRGLSARALSHEADRADIIHLDASGISQAKWQVPSGDVRLRDLFSCATLDRRLLCISLDLSEPGDVVVFIVISDNINQQLLKIKL